MLSGVRMYPMRGRSRSVSSIASWPRFRASSKRRRSPSDDHRLTTMSTDAATGEVRGPPMLAAKAVHLNTVSAAPFADWAIAEHPRADNATMKWLRAWKLSWQCRHSRMHHPCSQCPPASIPQRQKTWVFDPLDPEFRRAHRPAAGAARGGEHGQPDRRSRKSADRPARTQRLTGRNQMPSSRSPCRRVWRWASSYGS